MFSEQRIQEPLALSLGNFDGLHVAHRRLVGTTVEAARGEGLASAVLTFRPHPREYFQGSGPGQILPYAIKNQILERMGLDYLIVYPFDREVAGMQPEDFVRSVLCERFRVRFLAVGFNYHFGEEQRGDAALLEALAPSCGYRFHLQEEVRMHGVTVSSSAVRERIRKGDMGFAADLLGYYPMVRGTVISGTRLGRRLGFPTANITADEEILLPGSGVYVGCARTREGPWRALVNVGKKPTIRDSFRPGVEAYLLDYPGRDLYGEEVTLAFVKRLRDEIRFPSLESLVSQIRKDEEFARGFRFPETPARVLFADEIPGKGTGHPGDCPGKGDNGLPNTGK